MRPDVLVIVALFGGNFAATVALWSIGFITRQLWPKRKASRK